MKKTLVNPRSFSFDIVDFEELAVIIYRTLSLSAVPSRFRRT